MVDFQSVQWKKTRENVSDRQIIAVFHEIWVAQSDVMSEFSDRKFGNCSSVRMRSTYLAETDQNDWRDVGRPSYFNSSLIASFSSLVLIIWLFK